MEDGSIRIEEATEEALGTYTCVPYNTLGTMGQSAPARLVLKVSPHRCAWPLWWAGFLWPTFYTCLCASIRTPHISRCYPAGSTGRRLVGSCSSPVQLQGTPSLSSPGGRYLGFEALALWGRQEEPLVVLLGPMWTGQMLGGEATLVDSGGCWQWTQMLSQRLHPSSLGSSV